MTDSPESSQSTTAPYRVLARKYRPATFVELIGQEVMVRTLTNAIRSDRLAHAYMLTGVRGVGKTTTARIIARALNCVGPDGTGGPTPEPCGRCEHCVAITEDRHVDVIEMDAASRTGVDDIRELIDGVRYKPLTGRCKIYIIDEVHMLSRQAFNALLKTLEEPPSQVKFVFATTEIRKVPITVLSRCQRFDLRRIDADLLASYLARIVDQEEAAVAPTALALLARAADGSVRDGLSLLDQAIATYGARGADGGISEEQIRDMLGLAGRSQILDLFDALMAGDIASALELMAKAYEGGADPVVVFQDLLEFTHWITRIKLVPAVADDLTVPEGDRERGRAAAERLSMATLTRAWQMLLKGLGEVQTAPAPLQAAEMVLVRLGYAAELPTPADIIEELQRQASGRQRGPEEPALPEAGIERGPHGDSKNDPVTPQASGQPANTDAAAGAQGQPQAVAAPELDAETDPSPVEPAGHDPLELGSFEEVIALVAERREAVLHTNLMANVHLVRFEPGLIEFRPGPQAPPKLANRLGELLTNWTGRRWIVTVSGEPGLPTLQEQAATAAAQTEADVAAHPAVRAAIETFPGAEIVSVRELGPESVAAADSTDNDEEGES